MSASSLDGPRFVDLEATRSAEYMPPGAGSEGVPSEVKAGAEPARIRMFYVAEPVEAGPMAFLVDQFPIRSRERAHFHPVDQFQLFFPAPGAWYKTRQINELTLHYADAFTTYGPFGTVNAPMSFLTLRAIGTARIEYMPESRKSLPPPPRPRHRSITTIIRSEMLDLESIAEPQVVNVIEPHPDRMAGFLVRLPAHTSAPILSAAGTGGQFYYVLRGSVQASGVSYAAGAMAWVAPGAQSGDISSGDEPSALVVVQYPLTEKGQVFSADSAEREEEK